MSLVRPPGRAHARRILAFACVVVVCVAGIAGYAGYAAWRSKEAARAQAGVPVTLLNALPAPGRGFVMFRSSRLDETYGRLGLKFLDTKTDERYLTPLSCDRVHFGSDRGICLQAVRGVVTRYEATVFDRRFAVVHKKVLSGTPSRARMSPDGRMAAITVFLRGHSYASTSFSTRTSLLDAVSGQWLVEDLEQMEVRDRGHRFKAADFNFWGVTFTRDARRFYATLQTGGKFLLVEGDIASRVMQVIQPDVECPSLSPDNTRVAFKRRVSTDPSKPFVWRLHVLDLASGDVRMLVGEPRSVDDQVEWLNGDEITYALPDTVQQSTAATNTWALRADGTGVPRRVLSFGDSPAVAK